MGLSLGGEGVGSNGEDDGLGGKYSITSSQPPGA